MTNLTKESNIIIINTAFLGDVLLTAFLTQKIKNIFGSTITVVTNKQGSEILSPIDSIDNVFVFDKIGRHKSIKSTKEFASTVQTYNFDLLISLHKSYRTSIFAKQFKDTFKIGFDNSDRKNVYDKTIRYKTHIHEAHRYLSTLFDNYELDSINYTIEIEDKLFVENLLVSSKFDENKKTVVVAPGSVWYTKKWGNKKFYDLSNILKEEYNIIAIGSKSDFFEMPVGTINLIGKTTFKHIFHLLSMSDILVTNDSAPTHLGSIVNIPTITIFGPTDPIFGFYPLSQNSFIIKNKMLKCSPCRVHGSDSCPLGTHECMNSIMPNDVAVQITQMLIEV